ncbi:hypothetical protein [Burkholderia ubonensis]|uniref:hypothetical protein n=1 Tax=Burkholderia ubonensis TaxID=101571 RepID=UPI000B0A9CE0|nr:hypothetical protein [Burkholderia ubonensis]
MTRKTSSRAPARKVIPSLLGALAKPAGLSDTDKLLLRALIALDSLHRGNGTPELVTALGHNLIVSENLCAAGYEKDKLKAVREGHAALVRVDLAAQESKRWQAATGDYESLRDAVQVYDKQLRTAPRAEVRQAQLAMVDVLVRCMKLDTPREQAA